MLLLLRLLLWGPKKQLQPGSCMQAGALLLWLATINMYGCS